jgi:agmatinase
MSEPVRQEVVGVRATMPYVGIPTFLKLPLVDLARPEAASVADFALLGIPLDEGTSNRPGARFGPRAVRAASTLYSYEGGPELFDIELGRTILRGARVIDAGDVPIEPSAGTANRREISGAVRRAREAGALPVCVGGDHSVTPSILRAWAPEPATGASDPVPELADGSAAGAATPLRPFLVHLDTHMDFDSYLPRHAHGTPVRIALEERLVAGVVQVGVRGLNSGQADWEEAQAKGVRVVTAAGLRRGGPELVLDCVPPGAPLYLSIDIDAFDPSTAPGTGTPEPGGLTYQEGKDLLRLLAGHGRVTGIDLVEVNPLYDHGEITAVLAARLLLDVMGAVWEARDEEGAAA